MRNKIFSIVRYNVEKNIRNKWFVILNVLLLLVTVIGINFTTVQDILKSNNISFGEDTEIFVYDSEDLIYSKIEEKFKTLEDVKLIREEQEKEYTKDDVSKNQVIVSVKKENNIDVGAKIISQEGVSAKYIDIIEASLKETREELFAKENNLSIDDLNKLNEEIKIDRVMLGVDNNDTDKKYAMQSIFNYIIFFILLLILSKIANDISQEKISKSIEYVLTSINEKGYLIAKVLSINLTFVLQAVFTIIYLVLGLLINSTLRMYMLNPTLDMATTVNMSSIYTFIDTNLIMYIVIAFIYLLFTIFILSVIQAIFSSKTTNISEAGNATVVLITVNLVIYILSTFLVTPLKSPTILAYIVSCLPIASMYFVPTMVLIGQANILQVVIATIILVISCVALVKYGSKMFKNGVLDYTNKKGKKKQIEVDEFTIQKQKLAKKEYSKIGYVIGVSVLIFVLLQLGATYVLQIFVNPIYNSLGGKISLQNITTIIQMVSFILSLVIPALFVFSYTDKIDKNKEENKKEIKKDKTQIKNKTYKQYIKYILIALPIVVIVQLVVGIILEKLGLNYDMIDKVNMFEDKSIFGKILFFIEVALLPAIFEELYIRKAILKFTKIYGTKFAIIASSLLFAVIHFNLSQILFAFIMGIILSVIAIKSKSIVPTFAIHLLNNGYAALTLIFESSKILLTMTNVLYVILIILGIILIIKEIIKSKGKVKILNDIDIIKNNEYKGIKKYRYILCDYSFILAVIVSITLLVSMQKILTLL